MLTSEKIEKISRHVWDIGQDRSRPVKTGQDGSRRVNCLEKTRNEVTESRFSRENAQASVKYFMAEDK